MHTRPLQFARTLQCHGAIEVGRLAWWVWCQAANVDCILCSELVDEPMQVVVAVCCCLGVTENA